VQGAGIRRKINITKNNPMTAYVHTRLPSRVATPGG